MSADAKVTGAESDANAGTTPDAALEGFYEALQSIPEVDQRNFLGQQILVSFLSESDDRPRDLFRTIRAVQARLEVDRNRSDQRRFLPPVRSLNKIFSVREARANFAELLNHCTERDVTIVRNSKPTAVLLSYERYEDLIDQIEDLQDQMSLSKPEYDTVSMEEAFEDIDD